MFRRFAPLILLAVAGPLAAQPGPGGPPPGTVFPGSPVLSRAGIESSPAFAAYLDPVVQAELKLSDEQKAKVAKIPDDLLAKYKDQIEKEKKESQAAAEKNAALRAELQKKIDAVLAKNLTADQTKRFDQMMVQAMGLAAFLGNPEIAKALSLPEDAAAKISAIQQANVEKLRKEFPDYNLPTADAETRQKYAAAQRKTIRETVRQFVETFTNEQKKTWKEMAGEPSEAAGMTVRGGPGATGNIGFLFSPTARGFWQSRLLGNDAAMKELKVEKPARDALTEGFRAISAEGRAANASLLGGGFGGGSLYITVLTEALAAASAVLTPAQAARLKQVLFQIRGTELFSGGNPSPDWANSLAKLTLTPAQAAKIDAVLADALKKTSALGNPFQLGFAVPFRGAETAEQKAKRLEYVSKVAEIERAALADIVATFDAGQKAEWSDMTGKAIDVTKILDASSPFFRGGLRRGSVADNWADAARTKQPQGHYAAALAFLDEAIRLAPTAVANQLQKAELLASCPSEYVRDGKQAVEIVRKVIAQVKEPGFNLHDALAMALAETGQFDEAVTAQEKAIALLPPPPKANPDAGGFPGFNITAQLKPQYEARLKLYREKKPYRQELPNRSGPGGPN